MGRRKSKSKSKSKKHKKNSKKTSKTVVSSSTAMHPTWIDLPLDVTADILRRLGAVEILLSAHKVCKTWRSVSKDPSMWRVIEIKNTRHYPRLYSLDALCRHAVNLSQGQLIDITLERFGDDELLNYISQRSSNLKRLTLARCYDMSGNGLIEAVKNFPQLEELHLVMMPAMYLEIKAIGNSCPMLKSFSFNEGKFVYPDAHSPEELALHFLIHVYLFAIPVAISMPNLRHLMVFANQITDVGLETILDGCPHLESLDLRQCLLLDLEGELGKRLSEQIKYLRRPLDSTDDYEWDGVESPS